MAAARINRRSLLRFGAAGAAGLLAGCGSGAVTTNGLPRPEERKLIVVQFGGGTRCSESIDDPEYRWIPRLGKEMIPRGTLFTNMRVEKRVVHPNSTGSIVTGHWEWDDLEWSNPVAHPTLFETYRRHRSLPDTQAWGFVYASILARTGYSAAEGYGPAHGANIVEPPTIPRSTAVEMDRIMAHAGMKGSKEAELEAARKCARLARSTSTISRDNVRSETAKKFLDQQYTAWKSSTGTTSHDAFLTDMAVSCMRSFAPGVIMVAYGEIDCAHYGSWSRYVDAIERTDALTWRLWQQVQKLDAYRDKTLMLVLPDHGRELESSGGAGFIHHSDFYTNKGADEGCRRVWMLALGPGVRAGRRIKKPVPITAAGPTGLDYLGLGASSGAESSVLGQLF
jgi:hypothetical protein